MKASHFWSSHPGPSLWQWVAKAIRLFQISRELKRLQPKEKLKKKHTKLKTLEGPCSQATTRCRGDKVYNMLHDTCITYVGYVTIVCIEPLNAYPTGYCSRFALHSFRPLCSILPCSPLPWGPRLWANWTLDLGIGACCALGDFSLSFVSWIILSFSTPFATSSFAPSGPSLNNLKDTYTANHNANPCLQCLWMCRIMCCESALLNTRQGVQCRQSSLSTLHFPSTGDRKAVLLQKKEMPNTTF